MNWSRDNASQVRGTVFHTQDHQVIRLVFILAALGKMLSITYLDEREPLSVYLNGRCFLSPYFPFVEVIFLLVSMITIMI